MSDNPQSSTREKADAAFRLAAAKVIARAKRHGTRIIVHEDGQIVERTPKEMEDALKRQVS